MPARDNADWNRLVHRYGVQYFVVCDTEPGSRYRNGCHAGAEPLG